MATPETEYESSWSSATSPKTSSSLSVQAGDVLVVVASGSLNLACSDSVGLTWTLQRSITTANYTPVFLWTATVASAGSLTVTVTRTSGTSNYGFDVTVWRGVTVGASAQANTSGAPSLAVTTTAANSALVVASSDWNGVTGARTWRTGAGAITELWDVTSGTTRYYGAYHADAGAAGSKTVGLSAPTGQKYSIVALELLTSLYVESDITTSWDIGAYVDADTTSSWDVYAAAESDVSTSWDVYSPVDADTTTSWRVDAFVDADATTSWRVSSYGGWQDLAISTAFLDAAEAGNRDVAAYAEMVDLDGQPVTTLGYVPLTSATITLRGGEIEQFDGQFTLTDPNWVPRHDGDPLHPYSNLRLRAWWGVKMASGVYGWIPLCTLHLEDPEISDDGALAIGVQGRDVLAYARRGGYAGRVLQLGKLTVTEALRRIFDAIAPHAQVVIDETAIMMPDSFEVGGTGGRDPATDWGEIAALAGWVVRSDRMGVIHAGPRPAPAIPRVRLIEGPNCRMQSLKRKITGSKVINRAVCRSTNPDITEPIVEVVEDADSDSPTWVGRYGPFELLVESEAIGSAEAARNMAAEAYAAGRRPTEAVTVTMHARPDLDPYDLADIQRLKAGAAGWHTIDGWAMSLPIPGQAPGPMTLTCLTRTLA